MKWVTKGFDAFRRGKFGNGGQNIYVSKNGVLQRIHRTSVFGGKYIDLVFCNSQNHEERVPVMVYRDPVYNPADCKELMIGGANDCIVADLTGDGRDSIAIPCTWDGMTHLNNSVVYYANEEGLSAKFVDYMPAAGSNTIAAGDFNGNGKIDLIFFSQGKLKCFFQDAKGGFGAKQPVILASAIDGNIVRLAAYHFSGDKCATLFIRKKDGSIWKIENFAEDAKEEKVFDADPSFVHVERSWDNYTQAVEERSPQLSFIKIDGIDYFTVFRKNGLYLYPVSGKGFGEPVKIDCINGMSAVSGDIFNRGQEDLVIASQNKVDGKEYSYIYLNSEKGFSNDNRIAFNTFYACDVTLGKFSGGKGLDIVIAQHHTRESYDNDTLIFTTGLMDAPGALPKPKRILSHDTARVRTVREADGRDSLVICNARSGSFIGDPDNNIYLGSADGYHANDRIDVPGFGSVDMVCCDLNDNGKADLVFANAAELAPYLDPGSYVLYQKEAGGFDRDPQCLRTYRGHGVVTGDFNHNGYLDLAFVGFDNPVIKIFYGSEKGYCEENAVEIRMEEDGVIYKEPRFITTADLNGDGYLDLIITMITGEKSFVLWGGPEGFSFKNRQEFNVHHCCNVKVADLNGNGYPDLIWGGHSPTLGHPHDAFAFIYWGGPEGYSEYRRTLLPSQAVNSISVADFNNDGLLDIFLASYQNGMDRDIDSYIYWNSPDGFHINNRTQLQTHAVSGSMAADFNDDGYIDLALANHKVNGDHVCYSTVWYNGEKGFNRERSIDLPSRGIHGMGNIDPGNVLDRSFNEYYESEVHEIPAGCGISNINWDADVPQKCAVFAQFRVADTLEDLAEEAWQGPLNSETSFTANERIETDRFTGKYMQYRLNLYCHNAVNTPRVREVTVSFAKLED